MKTYLGVNSLPKSLKSTALTIGNFDGVHKGHRLLVERVLAQGETSVVMSFDPHPMQVLAPHKGLKRLFALDDVAEQLEKMGVDYFIVEPFSREFSELSAEFFLHEFVVKPLNPKHIVVGHDFAFGAHRRGDVSLLKKMGQKWGYEVEAMGPVKVEGQIVSSSAIRQAVAEGKMLLAQAFLGRPFEVRGIVEKGMERGRQLGFPTANLRVLSETLPRAGVYLGKAKVGANIYPAVANVGVNPTFAEALQKSRLKVECHLIDQNLDLYGQEVRFQFLDFIRPEKKFSTVNDLVQQIKQDVALCRQKMEVS